VETLTISELFELGDAFARLNDPEHFPHRKSDEDAVAGMLASIIGADRLRPLELEAKRRCDAYLAFSAKDEPKATTYGEKLFEANQAAQRCPSEIKEALRTLYLGLVRGQPAVDGINLLARDIVPAAGFVRGCLYLLYSEQMALVPVVRIGEEGSDSYRPLDVRRHAEFADALYSEIPVKLDGLGLDGGPCVHVTGAVGTRERPGVLFLELSPDAERDENHDAILLFRALRQAFNDTCGWTKKES
jgi:hypothetical protein